MKNHIIALFCCIIALMSITLGLFFFRDRLFNRKQVPGSGNLVINGKNIDGCDIIIYPDCTMLPLTKTLSEFGVDINWIDSNTAEICHSDRSFVLNIEEKSFVECKLGHELLEPFPGSDSFCCVVIGNEVLLDSDTVTAILACYFDIKTDLNINYEYGLVSLDEIDL